MEKLVVHYKEYLITINGDKYDVAGNGFVMNKNPIHFDEEVAMDLLVNRDGLRKTSRFEARDGTIVIDGVNIITKGLIHIENPEILLTDDTRATLPKDINEIVPWNRRRDGLFIKY